LFFLPYRFYATDSVPAINMPALSPSMDSGTIVSWAVKEGDSVKEGDLLAEIQTDKSVMNFVASDNGFIAKILVESGKSVPVGTPVIIVVAKKNEIDKYKDFNLESLQKDTPKKEEAPAKKEEAPAKKSEHKKKEEHAPKKQEEAPKKSEASQGTSTSSSRIFASPLAKSIAAEKGIDLSTVSGTGPNGRIIRADVLEHTGPKAAPSFAAATGAASQDFEDISNSKIRQITAERLTYSKQNIPHYYLTVEISVDKLLQLRSELNQTAKDYKLSVNDFVIKAAALALKAVPEVNSEWRENSIRRYHNVHINFAVNTPRGLLTPVIRDADKIGLKTINSEVKTKAGKANEGKVTLDDLQQGTFTISNLGMMGVSQFTAVISPPQAAILAVGTTKKVPVVVSEDLENPKIKVSNVLTVTLSCDHRVIDGAIGAQWLQVFKDLLENPIKFLL
jgi:pyruvate dehydrogenase E2 component (dihydrolipoamide acetyltransferase)